MLMRPLRRLDQLLNRFTMYAIVLYGLGALVIVTLILAFTGALGLPALPLIGSLAVLFVVGFAASRLFPLLFDAAPNLESSLITTLILFFIMPPPSTLLDAAWLAAAAAIAIGSKYILAYHRKHLFNPAALAAAVLGLTGVLPAIWWVANPVLLPFTLVLGLLIVRKLRRFRLFLSFTVAALIVLSLGLVVASVIIQVINVVHPLQTQSPLGALATAFTSWPLIFLGTIMLTEPTTTPPRHRDQIIYGVIVGAIFTSQFHTGTFATTPEIALLIGNVYAYIVSPKYRLRLHFKERVQLSDRIWEFRFVPDRPITYTPGQYMDFTLPHPHPDLRGNRRTFSLASSPTEPEIRLGIKFYEPSSSFKTALQSLKPGTTIMAGGLSGDFILPADTSQKLLFIAGGIGITPFRSMLKHLVDTHGHRDIVLFYGITSPAELSFREVLDAATAAGVKVVPILGPGQPPASWRGRTGFLDAAILEQDASDFRQRRVYISGPNAMVDRYRDLLRELGVPTRHIVTDYFSGY